VSGNNAKDILLAFESTLTASPTLVTSTCLKEIQIGRSSDHTLGFPYLTISLGTFVNPVADTVSYERVYGFNLDIWQEMTNKSKRNAELDLANALHKVLDRLSGTWQLGIGVESTEIVAGQIQAVETNAGPMLVAPIKVNVTTLIQNPT
jgi:hypothetical protein